MTESLLILNYHQVIDENEQIDLFGNERFAITRTDFLAQIRLIKQKNIPIVSLSEWKNNKVKEPLSIALTFDDGFESDYKIVFPILKKEGVVATFYPILSEIGTKRKLTEEQLIEMTKAGVEFGSHGMHHLDLLRINQKDRLVELTESKKQLEKGIDQKVNFFSFPFGMYKGSLLKQLQENGYTIGLTTRSKINTSKSSFLLHRMNMKNGTTIEDFEKIISLDKKMIIERKIRAQLSFFLNKLFGSNRVNVFINKL